MTVLITGVGGLIGAAAARRFAKDHKVVGVDNDMRAYFFGAEASTAWAVAELEAVLGHRFTPVNADIRDRAAGYPVSIVKAGMTAAGRSAGPVRPPLTDLTAAELAELTDLVKRIV